MSAPNSADELADPLDVLLIDTALGPMRRFRPDSSTLSVAAGLARRPERTARRPCSLEAEIGRIIVGVSR
jgi:polyhydroxyalkanoate synthase